MKKLAVMGFMIALVSLALSGESELEHLRGSYNAAVIRATTPLKASYEKELQRLLQRYTQASKINEAAEVMAELQRMNTNVISTFFMKNNETDFFIGHTWCTPLRTRFTFKKNNLGSQLRENSNKDIPFKWIKTKDDVEVSSTDYLNKPCIWRFRFVSIDEVYFSGPGVNGEVLMQMVK